jgi:hypothetical protein
MDCYHTPKFPWGAVTVFTITAVPLTLASLSGNLKVSLNLLQLDAPFRAPLRPNDILGHAFTVCIRTENQNQMPLFSQVANRLPSGLLRGILTWPLWALRAYARPPIDTTLVVAQTIS